MKIKLLSFLILSLTLTACTELNSPYGSSGSYGNDRYRYDDPYYRRPNYDYDRDRYYDKKKEIREDRRELERERERLEEERRRVEQERARRDAEKAASRRETCPSGFSPSENKCSAEERRRGCKDMRLPGGLGCVRR